jgi:hypothetical protein
MDEMHRREVVRLALAGGLAAGLVDEPRAAADEPAPAPKPAAKTDRDFVIAAGMTEAEADCWAAAAQAAGLFFALPELHPMDLTESISRRPRPRAARVELEPPTSNSGRIERIDAARDSDPRTLGDQ